MNLDQMSYWHIRMKLGELIDLIDEKTMRWLELSE